VEPNPATATNDINQNKLQDVMVRSVNDFAGAANAFQVPSQTTVLLWVRRQGREG